MSKRKRDPAFATSEKMSLIDLVEKYFSIIENKKTDTMSIKYKLEQWKKIEEEFNSISGIHPRDAVVLRNCWENLKKRAKQQQTQHNQNYLRTGGGPPKKIIEDPATERVLELIKARVTGYINQFDSDGTLVLASSSATLNEDHMYMCTNDTTNSESHEQLRTEHNIAETIEVSETFTDWSQYTPIMLRDPTNPALTKSPSPSPDVQSYVPPQSLQQHETPSSPPRAHTSTSSNSRRRPALKRHQSLNNERLKTIIITTSHATEEHELQMKILKLKEEQEKEILQQEKIKTEQEKIKLEILKSQLESLKKKFKPIY